LDPHAATKGTYVLGQGLDMVSIIMVTKLKHVDHIYCNVYMPLTTIKRKS
jgi:hypothetical protein